MSTRAPVRPPGRGVAATMVVTLYLRAVDAASARPILGDPVARDVLARLRTPAWLPLGKAQAPLIASRARVIDAQVAAALRRAPDAVVAHLACGLDSRSTRLDLPAGVRWIDLDQPEVVAVREQLYPARPGVETVAGSATDAGFWAGLPRERPVVVVAEGLLVYLDRAGLRAALTPAFDRPGPVTLVADTVAPWVRFAGSGPLVGLALGTRFRSSSGDLDRVLAGLGRGGRAGPRVVDDVDVVERTARWSGGVERAIAAAVDRTPGAALRVRTWVRD